MLQIKRFLYSAVLLALTMSFALYTGKAEAVYVGDGSVQDGTTGGWIIGDMGVCVTGIKSDGTMVFDTTKTSRAACIATTFPSLTTQAACLGDSDANGGSHYWTNSCVDAAGNGISLEGLDRNANMCVKKGGTWKQACVGSWVFTGRNGDGAPGFCYTKVRIAGVYDASTCPTTPGYAWDAVNSTCDFNYGIAGYLDGNITRKNGTAGPVAGTFVDLSGYTSQGVCLKDGFQWGTGVTKSGNATVATTPDQTTVAVVTGNRAGCLECHNNTTQYNSYAERWKTDYLKTGHKNMLRKVTPGMNWAGPGDHIYTEDASGNSINFTDGTITVAGTARKLFYLYGNWMAPEPTTVYNTNGDSVTSNGYSCAACHTTGWSNPSKGVCYPDSTKTSSATCVSPNTWVASTGVQGTVGAEPQASFPGITGITGNWDIDGITCTRCHAVTFPDIKDAAGNAITTTHETDNLGSESVNNMCFGCHQSPATNYVAGAVIGGVTYPVNAKILDPTMIPTGVHHGADSGREFNGHVLGNAFLNSPHSRFTGTIIPNSVGKYDIAGGTYGSSFSGFLCRTSATAGGGSILKMKPDGTVIKNLEDCNEANNKPVGTTGYWQSEGQGKCTTCHDVHQSVVPAVGAAEPFVRECQTCHGDKDNKAGYKAAGVPQTDLATIKHVAGPRTPLAEMATHPNKSCEICHMPKSTEEGLPMHLWRINTDANYSTFPTRTSFYGGSCSVNPDTLVSEATCTNGGGAWTASAKDRRALTAPDGSYENAVWVDLGAACGQCHGDSASSLYLSPAVLAQEAYNMHNTKFEIGFTWQVDAIVSGQVNFDASSSNCPGPAGSSCTYDWNFGNGATGSGLTVSNTYANATPVTVTLTVTNTTTLGSSSTSQTVTPVIANTPPTASRTVSTAGMTVTVTDNSSDVQDAQGALVVTIQWGDGSSDAIAGGTAKSHTYALGGNYVIKHSVKDSGGLTASSLNTTVSIAQKYNIGGSVTDAGGAPVSGVKLSLMQGTTVKQTRTTGVAGTYEFANLLKGCYIVVPSKLGSTFTPASQTICIGPSATVNFTTP